MSVNAVRGDAAFQNEEAPKKETSEWNGRQVSLSSSAKDFIHVGFGCGLVCAGIMGLMGGRLFSLFSLALGAYALIPCPRAVLNDVRSALRKTPEQT